MSGAHRDPRFLSNLAEALLEDGAERDIELCRNALLDLVEYLKEWEHAEREPQDAPAPVEGEAPEPKGRPVWFYDADGMGSDKFGPGAPAQSWRQPGRWYPEAEAVELERRAAANAEPRDGAALIAAERRRQVEAEGYTPEHDDQHRHGEIAIAAACYAIHSTDAWVVYPDECNPDVPGWPWGSASWKPKGRVRDLVRAGALIAAEIDRERRPVQALSAAPQSPPEPAAQAAYNAGLRDAAQLVCPEPSVEEERPCADVAASILALQRPFTADPAAPVAVDGELREAARALLYDLDLTFSGGGTGPAPGLLDRMAALRAAAEGGRDGD